MAPITPIHTRWSMVTGPMLSLGLILGIQACTIAPDGPEDCPGLAAGDARDNCWLEHATELFQQTDDRNAAIATIESEVEDPQARDFIWLAITREVDPSSFTYCKRIEEQALAERCRVLVSRPHLHRELVGGGDPSGAGPGGPPPGAGPGGPPPGAGPGGPPPRSKAGPPQHNGPPPPQ